MTAGGRKWGQSPIPLVAGVDEAGRGPLAGPVFAAAVILDPARPVVGLADSKRLAERTRERLAAELRDRALAVGIGTAAVEEIDAINIREATFLAMRRALLALAVRPARVRVDGNALPPADGLGLQCEWEAVVRGDATVPEISAASIVAKCARDAWMREAAREYPGYGFEVHKGYGTAAHIQALASLGPCRLHRLSFAPVKSARSRS
ncbi:MAG: ribonuclease HII [Steroidobacteraceae bacterium]|nr:ribonuclease HII [Steroidobacteraceae bacterium]